MLKQGQINKPGVKTQAQGLQHLLLPPQSTVTNMSRLLHWPLGKERSWPSVKQAPGSPGGHAGHGAPLRAMGGWSKGSPPSSSAGHEERGGTWDAYTEHSGVTGNHPTAGTGERSKLSSSKTSSLFICKKRFV